MSRALSPAIAAVAFVGAATLSCSAEPTQVLQASSSARALSDRRAPTVTPQVSGTSIRAGNEKDAKHNPA